jgi:hypothetical protein
MQRRLLYERKQREREREMQELREEQRQNHEVDQRRMDGEDARNKVQEKQLRKKLYEAVRLRKRERDAQTKPAKEVMTRLENGHARLRTTRFLLY